MVCGDNVKLIGKSDNKKCMIGKMRHISCIIDAFRAIRVQWISKSVSLALEITRRLDMWTIMIVGYL